MTTASGAVFGGGREENLEPGLGQDFRSDVPSLDDCTARFLCAMGRRPLTLDEDLPELRMSADLRGASSDFGGAQRILLDTLPGVGDTVRGEDHVTAERGE